MIPAAFLLALLGWALVGFGPALAQGPRTPAAPSAPAPATTPHTGELDCRQCHQGSHGGVVGMYLGMGGRGTPMIPSHMFQVRVQCVACHIAPKADEGSAGLVGRTFRPTEQACVNCHGEKYRGMLQRWVDILGKMRDVLAPKVSAARAALAGAEEPSPKRARAERLTSDAEYNMQFVALGKGVHNVFYAADLLKLSKAMKDGRIEARFLLASSGCASMSRIACCAVI